MPAFLHEAAKQHGDPDDWVFCFMCKEHRQLDTEPYAHYCKLHNIELYDDNKPCADHVPDKNHETKDPDDEKDRPKYTDEYHTKSDLGNAKWLLDSHNGDLKYCVQWGKWLIWNSKIWEIDNLMKIYLKARKSIEYIYKDACDLPDNDARKDEFKKRAGALEYIKNLRPMIEMAKTLVPIIPNQLDTNDYYFPVSNGIIDLKTGNLTGFYKDSMITRMTPIIYNPGAKCPRWLDFLNLIFDSNQNVIKFIQKAIGYSLTGDTGEQCMFILYGTGNNGKSVFINVILALMGIGVFAEKTPSETLMQKKYSQDDKRNDLARLQRIRFLSVSEGEEYRKLHESIIKDITGGDYITCRFLHKEFFTYKPNFKIWFATNHKPIISGTDNAIWRRIRLIPFNVNVTEKLKSMGKDSIPNYENTLIEELPGILNWAIEGCMLWQKEGLKVPDEIRQANIAYKVEMDVVQTFIDECCIVSPSAKIEFSILYQRYVDWAKDNNEYIMSSKKFAALLGEKGYDKDIGSTGIKMRLGITLNGNYPQILITDIKQDL